MNILMLGWEYPPAITGGLGVALEGMARALIERGHRVTIFLPRLHGGEKTMPGLTLMDPSILAGMLTPEEIASIHWKNLQLLENFSPYVTAEMSALERLKSSESASGTAVMQSVSEILRMKGGYGADIFSEIHKYKEMVEMLCRKIDFDLIHAHDWVAYPAGMAAAYITGKELISHVHATEYDRSGAYMNQYVYDLEAEAFRKSRLIVTVSRYTGRILCEKYGVDESKIRPVHNGIEALTESCDAPDVEKKISDPVVLFLGRITMQKGPEYFVQAASLVRNRIKNVRFVMAGTGDMYHRMIDMAADIGMGDSFHYTGFLNREGVERMMSVSDLYVMPSVSEPFGITPLEAVRKRVPVIVSRQSGVREVLRNCISVDFWDINGMAKAMTGILLKKHISSRLSSRALQELKSEKISWKNTARSLEGVYQEALFARAAR